MSSFEEATETIKSNYAKRRVGLFAKKNNVEISDVEVIDEVPVMELEKNFKKNNGIRTRLYKNLSADQQQAWLSYYDDHKQLSLRVKDGVNKSIKSSASDDTEKPKRRTHKVSDNSEEINDAEVVEKHDKPKRRAHNEHPTSRLMTDDQIVEHILNDNINEVNEVKPKRRTHKVSDTSNTTGSEVVKHRTRKNKDSL